MHISHSSSSQSEGGLFRGSRQAGRHHNLTSFNPVFDLQRTQSQRESAEWETALPLVVLDQDLRKETSHTERAASLPKAAVCLVMELSGCTEAF